jgi:hypothetical protein
LRAVGVLHGAREERRESERYLQSSKERRGEKVRDTFISHPLANS